MKRVTVFLILLITAIAALIAATAIGFAVFSNLNQTNPYSWMSQMFGGQNGATNGMGGGMMGQTPTPQAAASTMLPYFGAVFAVLSAVSIVGVIGVAYYLVVPQIKVGNTTAALTQSSDNPAAYNSVAKTLTEDERKIVETLKTHQGKYRQKYIKNETGLSRLQTHRVIARLSERGIVKLEKVGNTNQVQLADWLNQS